MTAEAFFLHPKHLYDKEQPQAAHIFMIKLSNLESSTVLPQPAQTPLPPQTKMTSATEEAITKTAEPQQEHLNVLTDNEKKPVECNKGSKISREKQQTDRKYFSI